MPGGLDIGFALGHALQTGAGLRRKDEEDARLAEHQRKQDELERLRMETQVMIEKLRGDREDAHYAQGRRDDTAAVTASSLSPWQEVDPATADTLAGTPQAGRLSGRRTLPSRQGAGYISDDGSTSIATHADPGGDPFNVWRPTAKEQADLNAKQERDTFVKGLPGNVGQAATARSYGMALDPSDFEDPAVVDARKRGAHEIDRKESFEDWQKREDYQRTHPHAPAETARDNPEFPRGVENYLNDLRTRGTSRDAAETEIARAWPQLLKQHPKLSPLAMSGAIDKFWPLTADGEERRPAKNLTRQTPAQSDGLSDVGVVPTNQKPRRASRADVTKVAKQLGVSEVEAIKQLKARGVQIVEPND